MKANLTKLVSGAVVISRFDGKNDRLVYAFPGLPPTANKIWRSGSTSAQLPGLGPDPFLHAGRRKARTHRAPDYVKWINERLTDLFGIAPLDAPKYGFAVDLVVWPPNNRRFDIDNRIKPTLDMLTHAGVWEDDSAVTVITAARRPAIVKGGWTAVSVRPAAGIGGTVSEIFWLDPKLRNSVIPKEEL